LDEADLVVIGPSNPLISIDPILRVVASGLRRERTVAVTPLVGGVALKGPTAEMMRALGMEVSPVEVARRYREVAAGFVLDETDRDLAPSIEALGYRVTVGRTVMDDGGVRLAALLLNA
jgi:LPPG:FO 2-phospho-L-lactate transferase